MPDFTNPFSESQRLLAEAAKQAKFLADQLASPAEYLRSQQRALDPGLEARTAFEKALAERDAVSRALEGATGSSTAARSLMAPVSRDDAEGTSSRLLGVLLPKVELSPAALIPPGPPPMQVALERVESLFREQADRQGERADQQAHETAQMRSAIASLAKTIESIAKA